MKNIIFIDTSDNKKIAVGIQINGTKELIDKDIDYRKAQVVLPLIEELLQKHQLSFVDLTGVEVHPGPGSFTGVRVGVTIANTLGFLLKIPVNGKEVGEIVEPVY